MPEAPLPFSDQYSTANAGAVVPPVSQTQHGQFPTEIRRSLQVLLPHQVALPSRGVVSGSGDRRPLDKPTAQSYSTSSSPMAIDLPITGTVLPEKNLPASISKTSSESVTLPMRTSTANPLQTNATKSTVNPLQTNATKSTTNPSQTNATASTLVPSSSQPPLPPPPITVPSHLFDPMPPAHSDAESRSNVHSLIRRWFAHGPSNSWLVLRRPWNSYYKDFQNQVKTLSPNVPWPLPARQAPNLYTIYQYADGSLGLNLYAYKPPQVSPQPAFASIPQGPQTSQAAVHLPQTSEDGSSSIASVTTPQWTGARAPRHPNTKSLAKDVLRALGYSPKRLKLEDPRSTTPGSAENVTLKSKVDSIPLADGTSSLQDTNLHESSITQNQPGASTSSEHSIPSQTISFEAPLSSVLQLPDNSSALSQNTQSAVQWQNTEAHPSTPLQQPQVSASDTLSPTQTRVPSPATSLTEDLGSTNMSKPAEVLPFVQLPSQDQYHADIETVALSSEIPIVAMPTTPPATPPLEPGKTKIPLFYPSPSSSPSRIASPPSRPRSPPIYKGGTTTLGQRRRARKKVYVLVPMLPYQVQRDPLTGVLTSTSRRKARDEGPSQDDGYG
jgi:hypothetical protein